jgi:hypothetical protein
VIAAMKLIRFDTGDSAHNGSDGERHVRVKVVIDEEKYIEITIRLGHTILDLAKAGLHVEECEGRVDKAIAEAITAIEQAGSNFIAERLFAKWPPLPFFPN